MAGDWIKMRTDLLTSPKVVRMASALNADRFRIVGGLLSVWSLFDAHSADGSLEGYSLDSLDDLAAWPGFSAAMLAVGWLVQADSSLDLPRFEAHNGASAKRRAQDADRKREVRTASASDADKKPTREEKRRVKSNTPLPPEAPKPETKPAKFDPLSACPANVTPAVWAQWVACRKEQGKPLKVTTCTAQAEQLAGHPNPDEVIRRSIAGGWQGLFPDKVTSASVHQHPASKHTNFDDLDYTAGASRREDGSYAF
ncbi:hypothetical protein [Pseudomonas sp. PA15(2017)]|uniref:hypothetical protein n=1 Tax=Pseudomonas sp. PA15(2017) TaxID=1932111 RepID=UPI000B15BFFD|nr:hypothetical protein [Pseudomonas sp. PA15(2017)]